MLKNLSKIELFAAVISCGVLTVAAISTALLVGFFVITRTEQSVVIPIQQPPTPDQQNEKTPVPMPVEEESPLALPGSSEEAGPTEVVLATTPEIAPTNTATLVVKPTTATPTSSEGIVISNLEPTEILTDPVKGDVNGADEILLPDMSDVLSAKVAANEWTMGEGLVTMLQIMAEEKQLKDIDGYEQIRFAGTRAIASLAVEYLETGEDHSDDQGGRYVSKIYSYSDFRCSFESNLD